MRYYIGLAAVVALVWGVLGFALGVLYGEQTGRELAQAQCPAPPGPAQVEVIATPWTMRAEIPCPIAPGGSHIIDERGGVK